MCRMRLAGMTLEAIGEKYGVSRERVRQITRNVVSIRAVRAKIDRRINARLESQEEGFRRSQKSLASWWRHVERTSDGEGCWIWRGAKVAGGYGHFNAPRLFGKVSSAHRQSFFLHNGYFPKRPMCVLHRCNNPSCVRPDHLYEGTMKENITDAITARNGVHWTNGRSYRHEKNAERDARIIAMHSAGATLKDLAREFGLSEGRISVIANHGGKAS